MSAAYTTKMPLPEFPLWKKMKEKRAIDSFTLEITARCNNNCRHCYINLAKSGGRVKAEDKEITVAEIGKIADEAISLGALWCLLTGGEPLLRKDFTDIYLTLKRKGLLVSVFTNAALINEGHIGLFKSYPPRDIEVTVYGVTEETYERVTRTPGSFKAFKRGLDLLLKSGLKIRLKTMALRSNVHELPEISKFCRTITKDYFRFDAFLHFRFDMDPRRNEEIKKERLSPAEIVRIEQADLQRFRVLKKSCAKLINPDFRHSDSNLLFFCGGGKGNFTVSYNGIYRPCSSLWREDCVYDLKKGTVREAWQKLVPKVRNMRSDRREFLDNCRKCSIFNLCIWCPAHAYLETGEIDAHVGYFCRVAHARAEAISQKAGISS